MTYEEEKELKRQQKLELKEKKKAEKLALKESRKQGKDEKKNESESNSPANDPIQAQTSESASDNNETVNASVSYDSYEVKSQESGDSESTIETKVNDSENKESEVKESEDKDSDTKDSDSKYSDTKDSDSEVTEEDPADDYTEEDYNNPDYKKVKKKKDPNEVNIVKELLSLIIYIGVVIILCYLLITYVGQRTSVNGESMENTLYNGDQLWVDKFNYHFNDPERFDIIVFPYPQDEEVYFVKRIIGLPGEKVQILPDGNIYINDTLLVESYGKEIILDSGIASDPVYLGEDEYFVMGDNRNDSRDSRWADVGNISREKIIGRVGFRLAPFSSFGKVE
ncbi:MAG: signal peptidase I [Eubacterium sp.]|nr:signal peptidase I [Eubacterium sp.]